MSLEGSLWEGNMGGGRGSCGRYGGSTPATTGPPGWAAGMPTASVLSAGGTSANGAPALLEEASAHTLKDRPAKQKARWALSSSPLCLPAVVLLLLSTASLAV